MPKQSKVEASDHFDEIMDMKRQGFSPRKISAYLSDEYNESIHYNTIGNYFKNLDKKIASEYYKQQKAKEKEKKAKVDEVVDKELGNKETVDEAIKKGVSEITALDGIIDLAENLNLDPSKIHVEYGPQGGVIISEFDVLKANALVANIIIKAVNAKANILKDEPESPTFIFGLDNKKERLKRIEGKNEYSSAREDSTRDKSDS